VNISQTSDYVLQHPFTKRAIRRAISGDSRDLKFIFDLLQIDTYQETAALCTRTFRKYKNENYPIIEKEIREVSPPTRLNIHLPIPEEPILLIIFPDTPQIKEA